MKSHDKPLLRPTSAEDEAAHTDSTTPVPAPPLPDVLTLGEWEQIYDALQDRDPDPNLPGLIAADHAKYNPEIIIAEGANEKIAELLDDDHQFVVTVNHIHEKDTGLAVRALYQTAFKDALARTYVLAKHEHFNSEKYRAIMEKMALAVFQPEKHAGPELRRSLLAASKRLEEVALHRMVNRKQHALIHGEGTRNTTENKNKVQKIRAILARLAIRAKDKGVKVAYLGVGITYPDPADPHGAVIKVGEPTTEFSTSHIQFAAEAQTDLQKLVDDAQAVLQESPPEVSQE